MNLRSSTLKDDGRQAVPRAAGRAIEAYRKAWVDAGWDHEPRVSVSRSIMPIVSDEDRAYFWNRGDDADQIGYIDATRGRSSDAPTPPSPNVLVEQLAGDETLAGPTRSC